MNLTIQQTEALMLMLAQNAPMWRALCRDLHVNPDEIAKALAAEHARKVGEL